MKTQIIQLEPHDDVISTRDKMGWSQTSRVVLVFPAGDHFLNRRLDLVLLQRHATASGAQLALVTSDTEVQYFARELGIAAFETLKEAQRQNWRKGRRRRLHIKRRLPKPDLYSLREETNVRAPIWLGSLPARLGFFALGMFSFLAVVLYLFPAATIQLKPEKKQQETTLTVNAGPDVQEITLAGKLPASWRSVIVEARGTTPTSGKTFVPEATSTGFVRFTNLTDHMVVVPRDLIVMTSADPIEESIYFVTTQEGRVAAGPGSSLVLAVRALSPGKSSNAGAEQLVAIVGPLGLELSATNVVATSGGTDRQAPAPTARDIENLESDLTETLQDAALEELSSSLQPGDFPITSTLTISSTLEKNFSPMVTEESPYPPASELSLTLRIEFKVMVVSADDFQSLGNLLLDASLESGYAPVPETLEIRHISAAVLDDNDEYHWKVSIQRVIEAVIDKEEAVNLVLGRTPENASIRLLGTLPLEGTPEIDPIPSWWPLLPVLPMRIDVEVME